MPILMSCPNPACGKTLTANDDFAGKKVKCRNCGTLMTVPGPVRQEAIQPAPQPPPSVVPVAQADPPNLAAWNAVQAEPPGAPLPPVVLAEVSAPPPPPPLPRPPGRRKRRKGRKAEGLDIETMIGQGILIFLVLLLCITPLLPWVFREMEYNRYENKIVGGRIGATYITTHARPPSLQGIESWQGKVVLGLTVAALLMTIAAVGLVYLVPSPVTRVLLNLSTSLVGAWAVLVLVYLVATIIKAFVCSGSDPAEERTVRIVPHLGIWFGAVLCFAIFGLCCALQRQGGSWGFAVLASGFLIGIVLALVLVRPWDGSSLAGLPQGTSNFGAGDTHDRGPALGG